MIRDNQWHDGIIYKTPDGKYGVAETFDEAAQMLKHDFPNGGDIPCQRMRFMYSTDEPYIVVELENGTRIKAASPVRN